MELVVVDQSAILRDRVSVVVIARMIAGYTAATDPMKVVKDVAAKDLVRSTKVTAQTDLPQPTAVEVLEHKHLTRVPLPAVNSLKISRTTHRNL